MSYNERELKRIFQKTSGGCHLCGKRLALRNYGAIHERGGWQVEHHIPVARGGGDDFNNLFPACGPCNLAKSDGTTRRARAMHGRLGPPLSPAARSARQEENAGWGALLAGLGALLFAPHLALPAVAIGAVAGHSTEPDPQKGVRRRAIGSGKRRRRGGGSPRW